MAAHSTKEALLEAKEIQGSLFTQYTSQDAEDANLRLLGFCLSKLGDKNHELVTKSNSSIQELLNYNDIYHRRVSINKRDNSGESQMLIVFEKSNLRPYAIYREKRKNWIYDPHKETHSLYEPGFQLDEEGFEIYLSLPAKINNISNITSFTFSSELLALIALAIASLVVMLFNLSIPVLTNLLVGTILPQNDQILLLQSLAIVLLITVSSMSAEYLKSLMTLRLEGVSDLRLQTALWDRLMRLPMSFIANFNTADLAARVSSISKIRVLLSNGVTTTLISSLFSLSYFVLMFVYDVELALWALAFTLISVISLVIITIQTIKYQASIELIAAGVTNFSFQAVMGMPQIRSAGAEPFVLLRWMKEINRLASIQLKANQCNDAIEQYGVLVSPLANLLLFSVVAVRLIGSQSGEQLNQIIVAFISFNAAFAGFNSSLTSLASTIASIAGQVIVLWRRAKPILFAPVESGYEKDAIHHDLRGNFEFRDICYQFPDTQSPLLTNVSFNISPGEHVAITGESGCGKTTLIKMLLSFTIPDSGEILVDDIPLSKLSIRNYRRQLGVVMQSAQLNPGSIYDVVCGGIVRRDEEVWEALEMASIASEVRAMPMQLETVLTGSGGTLSGGQVQRLAIARALITKPKALIMDEATSALDNASQQTITNTIQSLGITRISIAHRLSTIKGADKIVLMTRNMPIISGDWKDLQSYDYFINRK